PSAGTPSGVPGQDAPAPLTPELADAVEVSRAAAEEEARPGPDPIASPVVTLDPSGADPLGEHVGVEPEGPYAVTHYFESNYPSYVGWRWAVTVAHAGPGDRAPSARSCCRPGRKPPPPRKGRRGAN